MNGRRWKYKLRTWNILTPSVVHTNGETWTYERRALVIFTAKSRIQTRYHFQHIIWLGADKIVIIKVESPICFETLESSMQLDNSARRNCLKWYRKTFSRWLFDFISKWGCPTLIVPNCKHKPNVMSREVDFESTCAASVSKFRRLHVQLLPSCQLMSFILAIVAIYVSTRRSL